MLADENVQEAEGGAHAGCAATGHREVRGVFSRDAEDDLEPARPGTAGRRCALAGRVRTRVRLVGAACMYD